MDEKKKGNGWEREQRHRGESSLATLTYGRKKTLFRDQTEGT